MILIALAVFLSVTMAAAWRIGEASGRSGQVDAIWTFATGTACLVAIGFGQRHSARAAIAGLYIAVWSIRLGFYLWRRSRHGDDPRYAALKAEWGDSASRRMFLFLQVQAVASWPLVAAAFVASASPRPPMDAQDALATFVFAFALAGEAVADAQMAAFKSDPANKGRICERGLWGWSRHPNYFFEWLGWLGFPLLALDLHWLWGFVAFAAPAWMYVLLVHISGVPPLEEAMRRSRGAAFEDYARRVNAFWPAPPRRP